MKKVICCFLSIILSFILCCCKPKSEKIRKPGESLSDGSATYYLCEYENNNLIHKSRYDDKENIIEEYEYNYSYDINGNLYRIKRTDVISGEYSETYYNKFKEKTEKLFYYKNEKLYCKYDFFKNGKIKKKYKYSKGIECGYVLYDYYTDNQLKSESEYNKDGKTKSIKTYYKNKLLYQIKEFDETGFVSKIIKYTYKNDTVSKKSVYDGDFNLVQVTDYTKSPTETTKNDK